MYFGQEVVDFGSGERYTVEARVEPNDFSDGEIGLEARRLKLDAHPCFRCGGICASVNLTDSDRARVGPHQTLNSAERARLPRSVRAQQAKDLPLINFEGHAVNCPLRTIADMEIFDLKSQTMRRGVTGGRHCGSQIMRDPARREGSLLCGLGTINKGASTPTLYSNLEHTVIAHPLDAVAGPTALMILGGSALYVAGHALFKVLVFEHRPWSRVAGIVVLVVALSDRVVYRQAS